MFCTECGGSISTADRVCPSCGARTENDRPAPARSLAVRRKMAVGAYKQPGFGVMPVTRVVLSALAEGNVLRNAIALVMRVGAVLILLGGLLLVIQILKMSFQLPSATATIGGLLLAVAVFAVLQIYLLRAQSVPDLRESPFTPISVVS